MKAAYSIFLFFLFSLSLRYTNCQKQTGKCRAPEKAPQNLEKIINTCQEEIKSALLQEALDIINSGGSLEENLTPIQNRPKRDTDNEELSNEERRVAGCLLQCVYKKVKAVDDSGFPIADGLLQLYNEGVQDRNYYLATVSAVRHCMSIAQQLKQLQPSQKFDDGQTCDLAYEMFECVSEKIDESCGIGNQHVSLSQHLV
ncbi:general odorant-binding protein 70 isoform X2 [Daktulosphaira vitifoliae]|uniref:general odorant-binding protein 70 isoform X2 n=1 Tax=Daktulosphaira vitifoliae TaxID=58002 RepID=UPI0021A9FC3E|nr:general odorant-binding protein 70 isoform X2 [Daktulosphaira vitifoliae]